jgi:DNA-binding transcriptional LysR family regulator
VSPKLANFARDYPDVELDITTEDERRRDLVAGRFDAGIHAAVAMKSCQSRA